MDKADASYHYESIKDLGLDESAGAIYIGVFLAWSATRGLMATHHQDAIAAAHRRSEKPSEYAYAYSCGEFHNGDFTAAGVSFANSYYRAYLKFLDNVPAFADYEVTYTNPDTWETYDEIVVLLDDLLAYWRDGRESCPQELACSRRYCP
ncbi:DUF7832 domain-containing protein [Williamsia phyllosphaerae]|uniref:DUF7832 domain-containing protein n=1 Tax=Williamsia phyllosphaerae TaxID=885042 RepID=A0ABQ1V4I2_9NOCA|nr:hypothetical protein [Williamsia phyllosphaerae]GGF35334.1 hypothetical protein GCM10007298_33950 [Williamsia phyllosphaerae]